MVYYIKRKLYPYGVVNMAKKQYSLDYNIERDFERLAAVKDILDNLENKPSNNDLELMASYILYGKDENGEFNSSEFIGGKGNWLEDLKSLDANEIYEVLSKNST